MARHIGVKRAARETPSPQVPSAASTRTTKPRTPSTCTLPKTAQCKTPSCAHGTSAKPTMAKPKSGCTLTMESETLQIKVSPACWVVPTPQFCEEVLWCWVMGKSSYHNCEYALSVVVLCIHKVCLLHWDKIVLKFTQFIYNIGTVSRVLEFALCVHLSVAFVYLSSSFPY
jgi:hypothetical protein